MPPTSVVGVAPDDAPAPGEGPPGPVAGIGRRFVAIVVDWLASIGISLVVFRGVSYGSPESSAAILLIFAGEVILLTWLTSASFGQRILGITVVRLDGSRLGLARVALRTLLICLVIPAVIYDSDGRGLHDRAVGSVALLTRADGAPATS
jgi:uncharacterized RDD family membrane protein YckC